MIFAADGERLGAIVSPEASAPVPTAQLPRYLEHLDLVFAFELMFADWEPAAVASAVEPAVELERVMWALGSHDFSRPATRIGEEHLRLAALLQLTLPGPAVVYQGDELGLPDGPGGSPPHDRAGRDAGGRSSGLLGGRAGGEHRAGEDQNGRNAHGEPPSRSHGWFSAVPHAVRRCNA